MASASRRSVLRSTAGSLARCRVSRPARGRTAALERIELVRDMEHLTGIGPQSGAAGLQSDRGPRDYGDCGFRKAGGRISAWEQALADLRPGLERHSALVDLAYPPLDLRSQRRIHLVVAIRP